MIKENEVIEIKDSEHYRQLAQYCNDNGLYLEKQEDGLYIALNSAIELSEEDMIRQLRELRKTECFSVVNRGKLWYDKLTEEQHEDLDIWYHEWLDVTETKIVPSRPIWLD